MKQLWFVVVLLSFLGASSSYADEGNNAEGTRILVTYADPGMSNSARAGPGRPGYNRRSSAYLVSVGVKRAANRIAKDFDLHVIDEWPILPLKVHCMVYSVTDGVPVEQLLDQLRGRPEVESAQRLNQFEVSGSVDANVVDPYSELQHNFRTLELAQAHQWSLGAGTSVTIIDTGADLNHPDLKTQIRTHLDFADVANGDFPADAHGTAIAGVIAAAFNNGVGVIGVAPSTQLTVLKACWYERQGMPAVCDSFTLAKALSHAVESDTDVINLSIGGPSDPLLGRLVKLALKRGIAVVAAAPAKQTAGFPAEIGGVIVVDSDRQFGSGNLSHRFPVRAPGDEILVPVPGGGYDYASGSSLSAAHVSGVIALLVAEHPGLSRDDINTLLVDSRPTVDKSVNACRALARLLQRSGCRGDEAVTQSRSESHGQAKDDL
jgi:subtilisin family serine protease